MRDLVQRLQAAITAQRLLPAGKKVLVAVSGGVDSMVLLHVLHGLSAKFRWQISVAHFNHQLRGRASEADARLVLATAKKLGLPFFCDCARVAEHARAQKVSLEAAARELRHIFLAQTARRQNIPLIVLAHHADDQVELFFLRLLRGAGAGLAGMKASSPSPVDQGITLVRPLLDFTKADLEAVAQAHSVRYRNDASNASSDFLRNRIRNELIPLLEKDYQPGVAKTVLRAMKITGAESRFTETVARQWLAGQGSGNFAGLPVALQRKVLQLRLGENGITADFDLIEALRESPGVFVSVGPSQSVARTDEGALKFQDSEAQTFYDDEVRIKLKGRVGRITFGGATFKWSFRVQKRFVPPKRSSGAEIFDAGAVGSEIVLRHWRPGDRFQPIGLGTTAKLQNLFVNAKISAPRRRRLIVAATAGGQIFWVQGLRIGEQFKLTPKTKRQFIWQIL